MISTAHNCPSSVLVPHVVTNSHLRVPSMVPTWERGTEFPYYATDDGQWSSAPWRGEFPHNLIFSPDIECFQGANIDSDYAWQSIWTYPSTEDQVKAQQNVGFDSSLQTGLSYGGYMSADSGEQSSTALLTPSPERSFEDHAVFPTGPVENLDPYQTIYPGISFISYPQNIETKLFFTAPSFSAKALFSDLRFTNLGKLGEHIDVSTLLDDVQRQHWMLNRPSLPIIPVNTRYDTQTKCYLDACYNESFGLSIFIRREYLDWLAREVLVRKSEHETSVILLYSALAIGCYVVKVEQGGDIKQGLAEAYSLFRVAEERRSSMEVRNLSKETFLSTLVMTLFARKCNRELESELLSVAASVSNGLELHCIVSLADLCNSEQEKLDLQRAYWLFYSIEKSHSLRLGKYSVCAPKIAVAGTLLISYQLIDDNFLDHQPPSHVIKTDLSPNSSSEGHQNTDFDDLLLLQCQFAKICSLITTKLYSSHGLRKSPTELFNSMFQLGGMLKHWKDSIPISSRPLDLSSASTFVPELCRASQERLASSYQYYEALLAIHGRWRLCNPLRMTDEDMAHMSTSREICLNVARMVLHTSSEFRIATLLSDWSLTQIPICSLFIIFLETVDLETNGSKEDMLPYLSIAEGFYGRLSVLENEPYKSVLSLTRIIRQILNR
ncbi:powdery mildew-specific hypothetical protein [Blumeria hordei DH14]|uniref:Transcription factor domain-containing protein n=1 Tax=Blumeria graminis f. sp. hordei (strain DH14) TaxID=546991 RepID=N1JCE0_BLUG1|nr:powdery mildew-specific hypothetical protein [Blumeria hordei DH14]